MMFPLLCSSQRPQAKGIVFVLARAKRQRHLFSDQALLIHVNTAAVATIADPVI
jgi:hypothetical protein